MKANDLMIGDWVGYLPTWKNKDGSIGRDGDPNDPIPFKVEMVCWNCVVLDDKDGSSFDADDISLYQIPLTLEILEKNRFKKIQIHGEKQDDIFQCYDGEITIEVGIYDPNYILIRYRYETPDGINSGELSSIVKVDGGKFYLHELQHALRLCGITREIII